MDIRRHIIGLRKNKSRMDANQRIPKYSPSIQYDHDIDKDEEELEEILIRMERDELPIVCLERKL